LFSVLLFSGCFQSRLVFFSWLSVALNHVSLLIFLVSWSILFITIQQFWPCA
jgi:hypothetical protein